MPKRRVVFWFDTDWEVQYVSDIQVGDWVVHGDELWMVSRVGQDGFEEYAICLGPSDVDVGRGTGTLRSPT